MDTPQSSVSPVEVPSGQVQVPAKSNDFPAPARIPAGTQQENEPKS
jgi:hypothetical protein